MPDSLWRHVEIFAFILLCSLGSLSVAWQVRNWGDTLSPIDAFSEANAVREVHNFLEKGIGADHGLGNVLHPGLYPSEGFAAYPSAFAESVTPSGVYTHYPPGPEYLLFAAMKLLGPQPLSRLRILPLAISWAAAVFFGLSLRRRFGPMVGWLTMLACAFLPTFSDADAFLHYDGYALSLLLVEIGISVGLNRTVLPYLALGFLQGWLSFDYAFLVATVPGAVELALSRLNVGHTARVQLALWRCAAAAGGFTLAHLLHFAEVWAFFGSFQAAVQDLAHSAAHRSTLGNAGGALYRLTATLGVLKFYVVSSYPVSVFFWHPDAGIASNWRVLRFAGLTLGPWWVVLTHLFIVLRKTCPQRLSSSSNDRPIDNDWLAVSLCGLIPCLIWYVVMLDHAVEHPHFLYRHLFFAFFLWVLFCTTALADALPVRMMAMLQAVRRRPTLPVWSPRSPAR